jgi:hypothetical protein
MVGAYQVSTLVFFLSHEHRSLEWKCVHVSENKVIVNKII